MTHRTTDRALLLKRMSTLPEAFVHTGSVTLKRSRQAQAFLVCGFLALASMQSGCASEAPQPDTQRTADVAQQSPEELDQLVAPIALYPDALVAQILAAASYPTEVVEAERFMQQHTDLKGQALAQAVDPQSWDPSVKALTQFPAVLATMDKNLSWTSALGEAYVNGSQNVLDAVQVMRQRAQQAGSLKSTPQETVTDQGQTIAIEPADPQVVYVPEYDPWDAYGDPLPFYPGWVGVPGAYLDGPGIAFGLGIGIGAFAGFGWGWHHWGADWHGHDLMYDHHHYISHSPTFGHSGIGHSGFDHGGIDHAGIGHPGFDHGGIDHAGIGHAGAIAGRAPLGAHSGAFGGFNHGGITSGYSSRGQASFHGGGGGGFHGGGGSHGGGGGGSHGGGGGHR